MKGGARKQARRAASMCVPLFSDALRRITIERNGKLLLGGEYGIIFPVLPLLPVEPAEGWQRKRKRMKILRLVLCLTVISAVCAGVLASVNAVTKETIRGIRAQQTLDAAAAVMPPAVDKVEKLSDGVFVGKDAAGKAVGYAVKGTDPAGYETGQHHRPTSISRPKVSADASALPRPDGRKRV